MNPQDLAAGAILPLVRRMPVVPDPLGLFGALTQNGTTKNVLLLESADAATGAGQRSILIPRSAVRMTCRGRTVRVTALTANGRAFVEWFRSAIDPLLTTTDDGHTLIVTYPAPAEGPQSDADRIGAVSPLDALRTAAFGPTLVSAPNEICHLVAGIFAYDLIDLMERLPPARAPGLDTPDFEFWIPEQLLVVDHARHTTTLLSLVMGGIGSNERYHDGARAIEGLATTVADVAPADLSPSHSVDGAVPPAEADIDDSAFADLVKSLKGHIEAGDVFQIVPSRTFTLPCRSPISAYRRLRTQNPSPYMFFLHGPNGTLFGASPETAIQVQGADPKARTVTIRPIAGTARRGQETDGRPNPDYDTRLEAALRTDTKELAEHMMLVDLARNDIARVSIPGTREVSKLLTVERYSHVMHLVSEVTGHLAPQLDALHAYAACTNMGTLVGAPKIRAAELLREVETTRRGAYGGAVGYITHQGEMDTAIVIRAGMVVDGKATVRAGAGIVMASDPEREAWETRQKAAAVLRAIGTESSEEHSP